MRKVTLYIAMSLDGYIADSKGSVDWLDGPSGGTDDAYSDFVKDIDTVIMGWNTYHQITTELSPGAWVYSELLCYVITHRTLQATDCIRFTGENPCSLVTRLRREPGCGIWICGGAGVIAPLVRADLIDEYRISVIPTLLGSGIRLWGQTEKAMKLRWIRTRSDNGITELVYQRR